MMLPCPFHQLTGFDCPFCGAQRGIVALLHGDFQTWWQLNPVLWCLMPYFVVWIYGGLRRSGKVHPLVAWCRQDKVLLSVLGLLCVWGVVRNLIFN